LRILFLTNSNGGVFTYTSNLVRCLRNRKNVVSILSLNGQLKYERRRLSELFTDYDVVHSNFSVFSPVTMFYKNLRSIPYIFTNHGLPQPNLESRLSNKIKYTVERSLLIDHAIGSHLTVAPSKFIHDSLASMYDIDSTVIYHGVDSNLYYPRDKIESKKKLDLENKKVILFVGKFHRYKDPITLIEAFQILCQNNSDLELVMIGSGELESTIVSIINKKNLRKKIKLLKNIPESLLINYFNATDIFAHTAVNEAFGLVIAQAMASGLPVVASNSGACPELIQNKEALFNSGNPIDLSEKLAEFIFDEVKRRRFGTSNRLRAVKLFSWEKAANEYLKSYYSCLS
jgi:glycosyltransferase involved in cell wall biosynthesis